MHWFAALHDGYGQQRADLRRFSQDYHCAPDPLDPKSAYGEGKRVGELLCVLQSRQSGFEAKIARCFAFIGPHLPLDAHFAAGNFIRDAIAGGPIVVKSDGNSIRSYLYASDLAIWLWTILLKGKPNRAYNVGSENVVTIRDLATAVAGVFNIEKKHPKISECLDGGSQYVPRTNLAKDELRVGPLTSLLDGIAKTAGWVR